MIGTLYYSCLLRPIFKISISGRNVNFIQKLKLINGPWCITFEWRGKDGGDMIKSEHIVRERPSRLPTHPGVVLKEDVLPNIGLTVTEAANELGVSRQTLA
jgi:hypothetical protein